MYLKCHFSSFTNLEITDKEEKRPETRLLKENGTEKYGSGLTLLHIVPKCPLLTWVIGFYCVKKESNL